MICWCLVLLTIVAYDLVETLMETENSTLCAVTRIAKRCGNPNILAEFTAIQLENGVSVGFSKVLEET